MLIETYTTQTQVYKRRQPLGFYCHFLSLSSIPAPSPYGLLAMDEDRHTSREKRAQDLPRQGQWDSQARFRFSFRILPAWLQRSLGASKATTAVLFRRVNGAQFSGAAREARRTASQTGANRGPVSAARRRGRRPPPGGTPLSRIPLLLSQPRAWTFKSTFPTSPLSHRTYTFAFRCPQLVLFWKFFS